MEPAERLVKSLPAKASSPTMTHFATQLSEHDQEPTFQFDGDDPSWAIAATQPRRPVEQLEAPVLEEEQLQVEESAFLPLAPSSFKEAGLSETQIEALICKFLLNAGSASGRDISRQIALPFQFAERLLSSMKLEQLVSVRSNALLGDYSYELTASGIERAQRYSQQTTYFGAAPVPLDAYIESVKAQSIEQHKLTIAQVYQALDGLVVNSSIMQELGEAMHMGRGLFLNGSPGNGKSTIAHALINAYSETIWIPRALIVGGEIIRLFDSIHHEEMPLSDAAVESNEIDNRWVRIRRPCISTGGELELSDLDVTRNVVTGINEAPLQLKSNGGILVFDDFGRNKFPIEALLNRLIVPLEKRVDALHVANGRTFRIPFQSLVIFSTNLDPVNLVDEAFLRRIPFSIRLEDPTDEEYRQVFRHEATIHGVEFDESHIDYLLNTHYHATGRAKRFCHPRDILYHVANACEFDDRSKATSNEHLDSAVNSLLSLRSEVASR